MSFLITGATGLIGHDFIKMLHKNNKVTAIYRNKKISKFNNKNVEWIKHDLKKQIQRKFNFLPRYIINCAIDQKLRDNKSNKYFFDNILITKNLINYAKINKVDLIVNLSSVDVYGKPKHSLVKEGTRPLKQSEYAKLKLKIERLYKNSDLKFLNLRIPGTLCSESIHKPERPWLNTLVYQMIKNKKITIYNPENKFNNLTSSEEILRFIKYCIKNKIYNDTFNFASKSPLTINQILKIIKSKIKSNSKIKILKDKTKKSFYISINKLEKKAYYQTLSTKKILEQYLYNVKKI